MGWNRSSRSGIRKKLFPDPNAGVKKASDYGSGSVTYWDLGFVVCRSLLDKSGGTEGGIISSGDKVGWHVITPFQVNVPYRTLQYFFWDLHQYCGTGTAGTATFCLSGI
jgi:hypothetical protein